MSVMNHDFLSRLVDRVEHRFYGKYRGFVVDQADPDKRGRLKVLVPSVLGDVVSGWALPCVPYGGDANRGFFFIPEKGAGVWVEFESGLLEHPVWVGTYWAKPGGKTEAPSPADTQEPPTSKMIKTIKHTIEFADEDGNEALRITDAKDNRVVMDAAGLLLEDGHGNRVRMDADGITLDSKSIKIGTGALEKLVRGDTLLNLLKTWHQALATHVHPNGNLGSPTGPSISLVVPPALDAILSTKHSVE